MDTDFIPDFTYVNTYGLLTTEESIFKQIGEYTFISIYTKVYIIHTKTLEIYKILGNIKSNISTFSISNSICNKPSLDESSIKDKRLVIGYENGSLELFNNLVEEKASRKFKFFPKRVNCITFTSNYIDQNSKDNNLMPNDLMGNSLMDNLIIMGSTNGSFCIFDLDLSISKTYSTHSSIINIRTSTIEFPNLIFCGCGDKSIKIYNITGSNIGKEVDILLFEEFIKDFLINKNEILVFFNSGKSKIINYKTKIEKPFYDFKKFKRLTLNEPEKKIIIQTKTKLLIYEFGSNNFNLLNVIKSQNNLERLISCDIYGEEIIKFTKDNTIEFLSLNEKAKADKRTFNFHESQIIDLKIKKEEIYSLSGEKLIIWFKGDEQDINSEIKNNININSSLKFVSKIDCENASCFELINNEILIGSKKGLILINRSSLEEKIVLNERVRAISSLKGVNGNIIAVCCDKKILFFDFNLNIMDYYITPPEIIASCAFSQTGLFSISCYDSKIYVYLKDQYNKDISYILKFTLYGHSLPSRSIVFSPDSSLLVSCGTDKLIKFWGMDFGECRKTLLGNSSNLEYLNNELYFYFNKNIHYNKKFDLLKRFNNLLEHNSSENKALKFNTNNSISGFIKLGTDFLISTHNQGLSLFTMNRQEFIKGIDDEDLFEEMEDIIDQGGLIADSIGYDKFLNFIEKIEQNCQIENDNSIIFGELYNHILSIEFNEFLNYLPSLDHSIVSILLETLLKNLDKNLIFNVKTFIELIHHHKLIVISDKNFKSIKFTLFKKISYLKKNTEEILTSFKLNLAFIDN